MAQLTQEKESKLVGVEVFYISFNRFVWLSSMQITLLSNCLHSKKKMLIATSLKKDFAILTVYYQLILLEERSIEIRNKSKN